jgi:hypothetical protein
MLPCGGESLPNDHTHSLIIEALKYNVVDKTSLSTFSEGFLNLNHWIVRDAGDADIPIIDIDPDENGMKTQRVFLSKRQLLSDANKHHVSVYPTITSANKAFGIGMSAGKPRAASWANQKNGLARSWILPSYHPRQHRRQCLSATIAAGEQPTRFYTPDPQQLPEYTLFLTNAMVNVNGIVGTHEGYVQFYDGCELGQDKVGREWHNNLMRDFKKALPATADSHTRAVVWNKAFETGKLSISGYTRDSQPMSKGNVEAGVVVDSIFVMDAIWDFNFHHVLMDSVARLVHWWG